MDSHESTTEHEQLLRDLLVERYRVTPQPGPIQPAASARGADRSATSTDRRLDRAARRSTSVTREA